MTAESFTYFDVKQQILMNGERRTFPRNFKNDHSAVVTGGEEIQRRMSGHDPKTIVILSKRMKTRTFL